MTYNELIRAWNEVGVKGIVVYTVHTGEKITYYEKRKALLQNLAWLWQDEFAEETYSWGDLAEFQDFFETEGRKYGLLTEFRENGIC